jgi:hypothetical protein
MQGRPETLMLKRILALMPLLPGTVLAQDVSKVSVRGIAFRTWIGNVKKRATPRHRRIDGEERPSKRGRI